MWAWGSADWNPWPYSVPRQPVGPGQVSFTSSSFGLLLCERRALYFKVPSMDSESWSLTWEVCWDCKPHLRISILPLSPAHTCAQTVLRTERTLDTRQGTSSASLMALDVFSLGAALLEYNFLESKISFRGQHTAQWAWDQAWLSHRPGFEPLLAAGAWVTLDG